MATLLVYLLILGVPDSGYNWVRISHDDAAYDYPADSFQWETAARVVIEEIAEQGYAYARVEAGQFSLVGDTLMIQALINKGPRVIITGLSYAGNVQTRPRLLNHLTGFQPFIYGVEQIQEVVNNLESFECKVVDWELLADTVMPDRIKGVADAGDSLVQGALLNFLIEEKKARNLFSSALGYGQEQGFTGNLQVQLYNLFGGRRALNLSWFQYQRFNLGASIGIRDPYPANLPVGAELGGQFRSRDSTAYDLDVYAGGFITRPRYLAGAGYSFEYDKDAGQAVSKNLAYTWLETGMLGVSGKAGQRRWQTSSTWLEARGTLRIEVNLPWGFSIYAEPSASGVGSADSLFVSELVALGGAASVRGYDEEEFHSRYAAWSRQELRWGSESFRLYPLLDAGWVADEGFIVGYGAGISVMTPVGRLQLDTALPLEAGWRDAKLHLRLNTEF